MHVYIHRDECSYIYMSICVFIVFSKIKSHIVEAGSRDSCRCLVSEGTLCLVSEGTQGSKSFCIISRS
jgi:hypothetical protein